MGNNSSRNGQLRKVKTPLSCAVLDLPALQDSGTDCKKNVLIKLCESVWPLYDLGHNLTRWPREGTVGVLLQYMEQYLWLHHRTREVPYLHIFYNLSSDPGICRKGGFEPPHIPRLGQVGALSPQRLLPIHSPPPYLPGRALALPLSTGNPRPRGPDTSGSQREGNSPPSSPHLQTSDPSSRAQQGPPPNQGTASATAPDPSRDPGTNPEAGSLPGSDLTEEEGRRLERLKRFPDRFTSENPGTLSAPSTVCPLRQGLGANGVFTIHTPLTTTDLYNLKMGLPPYWESPQRYVDLISRIISTYHPNIPDLFALLSALLDEEEKRRVMENSYAVYRIWRAEYIQAQPAAAGNSVPIPPTAEECLCPNPPEVANDPTTELGRRIIAATREAVREGLKRGVPRVENFQNARLRRKASPMAAAMQPTWQYAQAGPQRRAQRKTNSFPGQCFRCNDWGHRARDCIAPPPPRSPGRPPDW